MPALSGLTNERIEHMELRDPRDRGEKTLCGERFWGVTIGSVDTPVGSGSLGAAPSICPGANPLGVHTKRPFLAELVGGKALSFEVVVESSPGGRTYAKLL